MLAFAFFLAGSYRQADISVAQAQVSAALADVFSSSSGSAVTAAVSSTRDFLPGPSVSVEVAASADVSLPAPSP
eukprot:CAMPEP_0183576018 /NCGR_PEP_ID=MMETSP0371-20130417/136763_1 /TAXON_ID=268820 /ORGANISM="Peridinium aciculiferum, Strain PAER-2" /LENGTH=73 /DNA_ID=CAMNT_0025786233 /DNA_START=44 /DNA_END=261 /DNA_ORIENTATION=+